jgi:hypothetical protein
MFFHLIILDDVVILGEREIVSWDLKVGTCTGLMPFFKMLLNFGV